MREVPQRLASPSEETPRMGHIFENYSTTSLVHKLKEYCTSQGLPFRILMVLVNVPAHPHVWQDLHQDILPPNTTSLLQPMDQGVIKMFKAQYLESKVVVFP